MAKQPKKRAKTSRAAERVQAGVYRHYKGNNYLVLGVARHSESFEQHVVYVRLYASEGDPLWIRPLSMFLEKVKNPKGKMVPRFAFVART